MGVVKEWNVTLDEIDEVVTQNPSLRGFLFGYLLEFKLKDMWFSDPRIQNLRKFDNHDRTHKGDWFFSYKGVEINVECKGLQSNSVKQVPGGYVGRFQCDASDRRKVTLPDGTQLETTCLRVGEFDLLAVGIFEFGKTWHYAFAKNKDLPRTKYKKYTPQQQQYLLAGTMGITWLLEPPYRDEPFALLDEIVVEKKASS